MTKKLKNPSSSFNSSVKNERLMPNYIDFNYLSDTLGKLFPSLMNSLYFSSSETSSKKMRPSNNNRYTADLKYNRSRICKNKTHYQTRVTNPNIVTVDLRKIEDKLRLSSKERCKLKRMLKHIIIDNEGGIDERNMCKIKNIVDNCSSDNSREYLEDFKIKRRDMTVNNVSKKNDSTNSKVIKSNMYWKSSKGCRCKESVRSKRKTNLQETFEKPSDHYDSGCIINTPNLHSCITNTSSMTRTILKPRSNINIANVRLKYVNPICFVQYGSSSSDNEDYSRATLKAHLGQGCCPQVNDPHPEHAEARNTGGHDAGDDYVIAKGTLTDELVESFKALKEIRRDLFPVDSTSLSQSKEDDSLTRGPKKSLGKATRKSTGMKTILEKDGTRETSKVTLVSPGTEDRRVGRMHWEVESFPSTLLNLEKDVLRSRKPTERKNKRLQRQIPAFSKLKGFFINTCFCFCFEDDSKVSNEEYRTGPRRDNKFSKQYIMAPTNFKSNVKIIRTTESDFLYNKPKTK